MVTASKILDVLLQPLTWVVVFMLLGVALQSRSARAGIRLGGCSVILLLLIGWLPLPNAALRWLESRHDAPFGDLSEYRGVIVLGGAIAGNSDARPNRIALNAAAERMTMSASLAIKYPKFLVLFTGGVSGLSSGGVTSAASARIFFDSLHVPKTQVIYESSARNTWENATLSAVVPGVDKNQRWLLMTSAWHMPRALAIFRSSEWNVTPYPVDFMAPAHTGLLDYSILEGAMHWNTVIHEFVGLEVYRFAGLLD